MAPPATLMSIRTTRPSAARTRLLPPDARARRRGQTRGRAGRVPVQAGRVPVQAGRVPVQAGRVPVRRGQTRGRAGRVPVLAGRAHVRCGHTPVPDGRAPPRCGRARPRAESAPPPPNLPRVLAPPARLLAVQHSRNLRDTYYAARSFFRKATATFADSRSPGHITLVVQRGALIGPRAPRPGKVVKEEMGNTNKATRQNKNRKLVGAITKHLSGSVTLEGVKYAPARLAKIKFQDGIDVADATDQQQGQGGWHLAVATEKGNTQELSSVQTSLRSHAERDLR